MKLPPFDLHEDEIITFEFKNYSPASAGIRCFVVELYDRKRMAWGRAELSVELASAMPGAAADLLRSDIDAAIQTLRRAR